ncbi:MAG TPA: SpoIIE family protein phosphatase [Candidatus Polarisedimenticolia bacterium]|nr:SpoIIE family protein phosphatase [Candidatus Polarisedimenticolia bacterium]
MSEKRSSGRSMRRVALAAGLLLLFWLVAQRTRLDSFLYGEHLVGTLLRLVTLLALVATIVYYGTRWVSWSWGRLLWRVRRRLAITYLLVGLTPFLLMTAQALISWFGLTAEAMARIITVQVRASADQAEAFARALATDLQRLPPASSPEAALQTLLSGSGLVRASLPGARVALLKTAEIPAWLEGQSYWSGLTHDPPPSAAATSDPVPPSLPPPPDAAQPAVARSDGVSIVRALAPVGAPDRPYAVLVEVPLAEPFVRQISEATGMSVHPVSAANRSLADGTFSFAGVSGGPGAAHRASPGLFYVALMPSTDWQSGRRVERVALTFDWSWVEAGRQVFGTSTAGRYWRLGLICIGSIFVGFELLALGAAAWMVRAVTGTVDRLHRATEFIGRGDFSHRIEVRSQDQLGELAAHFNDMSAHIEHLLLERVERERLEREIEIAAGVQARLFPRLTPRLATAEISGECRAARGVAGDYYDYLEVGPGLLALALGDVAGKGISASLLMSNLQASLRAQVTFAAEAADGAPALGADQAIARIAGTVNRQICRSADSNRYATLFLALYDDRSRLLRYTNAGHNPAILMRPDGAIERLSAGGTIIGAFDWVRYDEARAHLPPEALLLLYSDGISEARNTKDEEFGDERLVHLAFEHRGLPADALRRTLFDAVDAWSGPCARGDDQTILIVKGNRAARSPQGAS